MGSWQLDPYHTQVEFAAKHLGMMTVRGYFDEVSAVADIDPDHPETSSVEVTISTASIRTNHPMRDNDLRSSNFLEVEKYPVMTFKSTSVEPAAGDHYTLTGDLTIKGTTRSVSLDVTRYGEFNDPGMMGHRIAYGANTKINRKDFGLSFNAILDGRLVVGEEIQIMIEGELVEQKEIAEATSDESIYLHREAGSRKPERGDAELTDVPRNGVSDRLVFGQAIRQVQAAGLVMSSDFQRQLQGLIDESLVRNTASPDIERQIELAVARLTRVVIEMARERDESAVGPEVLGAALASLCPLWPIC